MYTYPYPRAALTVDAIVFVKEQSETFVLLIERKQAPYENMWALPGGFMEMDETLQQACIRELKEETGLSIGSMEQFRAYDALQRDPRHRTISVVFSTELVQKEKVTGSDDAAQAKWFSVKSLPHLAFDHQTILEDFFEL